jgi:hypothetical protein
MNEQSTRIRAGLYVLGLCSLADVAIIGIPDGPPAGAVIGSAVIGVASLVLVIRSLRDAAASLRALALLRVLSAISAVLVFFADASVGLVVGAAITITVNVIGLCLLGRDALSDGTEARRRTRIA